MEILKFEDLFYDYPKQDDPNIQKIISGKEEFNMLKNSTFIPSKPGQYYPYQEFVQRYMMVYDRLLLYHGIGSGKSCSAFATSEMLKKSISKAIITFVDSYIKLQNNEIKKVDVFSNNESLREELKHQLYCKCTPYTYFTKYVISTKTDKGKKINLAREAMKYYRFYTYDTFAADLEKKKVLTSPEYIKEAFSNTLFIIDEAQLLRPSGNGVLEQLKKSYTALKEIFRTAENIKILLLSGTPMVNSVDEIVPLLNLILPENKQLPLQSYAEAKLEDIEHYVRGYVSFVRGIETPVTVKYNGKELVGKRVINDIEFKQTTYVYESVMSSFQEESYIEAAEERDNIYNNQTQASNFVFPDGSFGERGFSKFVYLKGDNVTFKENMPKIKTLKDIKKYSTKFASVVDLCTKSKGNCFCFTRFLEGSGAYLLSLCFEALGYERFDIATSVITTVGQKEVPVNDRDAVIDYICGSSRAYKKSKITLEKKLRYAIITRYTNITTERNILKVFNSSYNKHGEYIKVLIATPKLQAGINLANVLQIHIVDPQWNRSNTLQAIGRAIRVSSHAELLKEGPVNIDIYQHVSISTKYGDKSSDVEIYRISQRKDIEINNMERILKIVSVDCHINYLRNIRENDKDYSEGCNYTVCKYKCFNPEPEYIDYSSYNNLYQTELIEGLIEKIKVLFTLDSSYTYAQLNSILETNPIYIQQAVEKLINSYELVINKFGVQGYIQENNGVIFIQQLYPMYDEGYEINYYTNNLILYNKLELKDFVTKEITENPNIILDKLKPYVKNEDEFLDKLNNLPLNEKILLLEDAIKQRYVEKSKKKIYKMIIDFFKQFVFKFKEPIKKLEELKNTKAKLTLTSKINQELVNELLEEQGEYVYIETLYAQPTESSLYNVISKYLNPDKKIRILKPSENVGWRDATPEELFVYNPLVRNSVYKKTNKYSSAQIYGIYTYRDNKFRVVDRSIENEEACENSHLKCRGKVCANISKPGIIEIFYKLNLKPKNTINVEEIPREKMKERVIEDSRELVNTINSFTDEKLVFYYLWYRTGMTRTELCSTLLNYFQENDLLLVI